MTAKATSKPIVPTAIRIQPMVARSTPDAVTFTAKARMAPTAIRNTLTPIPIAASSLTTKIRVPSLVRWHARTSGTMFSVARPIWSGAISFGLVNVPVKLFSSVSPKDVRFHQIDARSNARIRQKRVSSTTGEEVPYEDIVKGYELRPDTYVTITPEEL